MSQPLLSRKIKTIAQKRTQPIKAPKSPRARANSRREFLGVAAGGALLSLTPALAASDRHRPPHGKERRTLFFDLSHENHEGHSYYLVAGKDRHQLKPCGRFHPALMKARRTNKFIQMLPDGVLTHVVENVDLPAAAVQLSYLMVDPDTSTGTWGMSGIYLLPPKSGFAHAYNQARKTLSPGQPLTLSAKRKKYALPPAITLQDLTDEQDVVDTTQWATALVNLHPELLCADPNTAAHIQTNHIQAYGATGQLAEVLGIAGPAMPAQSPTLDNSSGWATLVPYTDDDNTTPLKGTTGQNAGLILYDAKWKPGISVPWVSAAMKLATNSTKNDTSLGADVTGGRSSLSDADLTGTIWYRNDGITSITQDASAVQDSTSRFTLSNITPNYNGYSLTSSVTSSDSQYNVNLQFKNWYVRWLGLFIQFLDANGNVVPVSQLPSDISKYDIFNTPNNEIYIGELTPEFTIFGIPVQSSGNTVNFNFPTDVASSAKILASGLGFGSHTYQDTELVGLIMTSIFNLSLPALLIAFGIGATVDACIKTVVIPFANTIVQIILNGIEGGTNAQTITIFWRAIVKGILNPTGPLKDFLVALGEFLAEAEVTEALTDAIPLVGAILQAIGALGALAEVTETSCEVVLSPWTYEYDLKGTYDLSVSLSPDPNDPNGFPAAAATYKVTAVFDNGTPNVQTLQMPATQPKELPDVVFAGVPLGGNVSVTVGFYAADGTHVGHGTTGPVPNVPPSDLSAKPGITITEEALPLGPGVTYSHKQKTTLDAQGNHVWVCAAAPAPPTAPSACQPNPGNLCSFRNITYNTARGYVGYGWQSYNQNACASGAGQLDQIVNIPGSNGVNGNAQNGYAATPCSLLGAAKVVYDPLGRDNLNYYLDTTNNSNILRQIQLNPPAFSDPRAQQAWGKFNLAPDDVLIHPSGAVVTLNSATSRVESLKIPAAAVSDAEAAVNLVANLHGGTGTRPGKFDTPTVATITAEGVILILEAGNNRIHAIDASANPVQLFSNQSEKYFLNFTATGGASTQYLDIAVEYTGFIYVLSSSNSVYRLDIYHHDQSGTTPISTTMGFNAAKVTVDYWRNVYSLNYEVLMIDGQLPPSGITEPSISQWIPIEPPPCEVPQSAVFPAPPNQWQSRARKGPERLLRRNFWRYSNS